MTIYTVGCHSIGKSSICVNYINIVLVDIYILDIFFWCSSLEKTNKHCDMRRPTESETPLVEKGKCASRHQFKKKMSENKDQFNGLARI